MEMTALENRLERSIPLIAEKRAVSGDPSSPSLRMKTFLEIRP
jgi:hypothetical protein